MQDIAKVTVGRLCKHSTFKTFQNHTERCRILL